MSKLEDRVKELEEKIPLLVGNIKGLCDMIGALSARVITLEGGIKIANRKFNEIDDKFDKLTKVCNENHNSIIHLEVENTYITRKNISVRMEAMEKVFVESLTELRDMVAQVRIKTTSPLEKKTPKASQGGSSVRSNTRGKKRQSTLRADSSRSSRKKG